MWNPAVIGFVLLIGFALVGAFSTAKPKAKKEDTPTPSKAHQRPEKVKQQAQPAARPPLRRAAKHLVPIKG